MALHTEIEDLSFRKTEPHKFDNKVHALQEGKAVDRIFSNLKIAKKVQNLFIVENTSRNMSGNDESTYRVEQLQVESDDEIPDPSVLKIHNLNCFKPNAHGQLQLDSSKTSQCQTSRRTSNSSESAWDKDIEELKLEEHPIVDKSRPIQRPQQKGKDCRKEIRTLSSKHFKRNYECQLD